MKKVVQCAYCYNVTDDEEFVKSKVPMRCPKCNTGFLYWPVHPTTEKAVRESRIASDMYTKSKKRSDSAMLRDDTRRTDSYFKCYHERLKDGFSATKNK